MFWPGFYYSSGKADTDQHEQLRIVFLRMRYIALGFIWIHFFVNKIIGIKIPGLGFAQTLLKKEFIFNFKNRKFIYSPVIEGSYDYLLIGKPNEPETHLFLDSLFSSLDLVNFIDVGASVGEFAFGLSRHKNIQQIYAFEPRPDCAEVLRKNLHINNETRINVFEFALDDSGDSVLTLYNNPGGSSSGIYSQTGDMKQTKVMTLTLDKALPYEMQNPVLLIDVEGAEPLVMKGGSNFLKKNRPLIIFEYNNTSKQHFNISHIEEILGPQYIICRLKRDGSLDKDLSATWNCVAIPTDTLFSKILKIQ